MPHHPSPTPDGDPALPAATTQPSPPSDYGHGGVRWTASEYGRGLDDLQSVWLHIWNRELEGARIV